MLDFCLALKESKTAASEKNCLSFNPVGIIFKNLTVYESLLDFWLSFLIELGRERRKTV